KAEKAAEEATTGAEAASPQGAEANAAAGPSSSTAAGPAAACGIPPSTGTGTRAGANPAARPRARVPLSLRRRLPGPLRLGVAQLVVDPVARIALADDPLEPLGAPRALLGGHRQGAEDRVRLLLHVERIHRQRELAELLVRARVLRQQRHPVALVHERALLRHEVHAVEHRVHDQEVVVLVAGDRLLEVLAQPQVD